MIRRSFLGQLAAGGLVALPGPIGLRRALAASPAGGRNLALDTALDRGWRFRRDELSAEAAHATYPDRDWARVTLPHTARIEAPVTGPAGSKTAAWQGICWYRRTLPVGESQRPVRWLRFEGAMNVADVWLDGEHLGTHLGGFTPFCIDLPTRPARGRTQLLAVRLDNRDNVLTGPKPLADLDFNLYGGLYRGVTLHERAALHLTDALLGDRPASGGVLVRTVALSPAAAHVEVQVHVRNAGGTARQARVRHQLLDAAGKAVARSATPTLEIEQGGEATPRTMLEVRAPCPWSPWAPSLYTLVTVLEADGRVLEVASRQVGLRHIALAGDGLHLNGERVVLRGCNRHQEHPGIGHALPDAAQWRDARRIKAAGFDLVRCSHYPPAPAFLDACDALGLAVIDCAPGWQFFNADPAFADVQEDQARRMLRRDRNHPSVLLWEVGLNETAMPESYVARLQRVAHEELPGDQCLTAGWTPGFDVLLQARQHGGCVKVADRPCLVSEYGDWEYYAQNAGFNQTAWADLAPAEANSRQLRWQGERALLQQATNMQEAHNDNRATAALGDGLWAMFDYTRGYAPDIESSGCMDLYRLPKFSYHFFRSQRSASERIAGLDTGPMVFIASHWLPTSSLAVRVFGNVEEVALMLNGTLVARQPPDQDRLSTNLAHPPFTVRMPRFEAGVLEAVGFIAGRAVAHHVVRTPGAPARLRLWLDEVGVPFATHGKDAVFAHAALEDAAGTLAVEAWERVSFGVTGPVALIGPAATSTEAGIASVVLEAERARPRAAVYAIGLLPSATGVRVVAGACAAGAATMPYSIHVTSDGSPPTPRSPSYTTPLDPSLPVRAALVVAGRAIAWADAMEPKRHLPGSAPPGRRE